MAGADTVPDRDRYSQSQTSYRVDEYVNSSSFIPDFYLCAFLPFYTSHNAPANSGRRVCFYGRLTMQTEPDVLTDHNELILSTNIERVVTGRDSALKQIEQLIQQLDAISRLTSEIGGGTAQDWAMKAGHRYDSWMTENVDKALPAITRNIDRSIWRDLMLKSGMMALMDAQARDQWHKNLEEGELPVISVANILTTFEQLHLNKMDVFERGIINVFKGLSWDYKTNSPRSFGKKIIVNNLVTHNRWGFSLNWGWLLPRNCGADTKNARRSKSDLRAW
ncbi:hypothetical protein B4907_21045 [Yersinia kristensenii]|nr:hypothetical protein B4907_21045 [Yersinia kristensenii]